MSKTYAFGVDIGGTTIKMGLFETNGKLLEMWEIPTRTEADGKFILNDIAQAVDDKLKEKKISTLDVEGIGLGVPGPVGPDGTVFKCVNLGWDVFNVEHRLSVLTGLRVKAGNDANVAALGEMWQGGGAGYQNIVMVTLGTGVGGGIIIDGHILPGINGAAGEIGHLPVEDNQPETCTCGNQGCLEQYSSATAVARSVQRYLDEHPEAETSLRSVQNIEAKDVFDAAKQDDKVALELTERACAYLGKGLAMIACVVNPEAFVIGGGMARAGEILMESVRRNFKQKAFHASRETEFKEAKLGNNAGIYGGVRMLLE